jgi:hypothetical protein
MAAGLAPNIPALILEPKASSGAPAPPSALARA